MLTAVKLALRISTDAYNDDLTDLIVAAALDLGIAGVTADFTQPDALVKRAIITYCRLHFGTPADADRLKRSYDEQKAQLMTASGYTDFTGEA